MTLLEDALSDITTPLLRSLTMQQLHLTPTEKRVALGIRQGCSTAEIARSLGIDRKSVYFHRDNIRRKCGLRKTGLNLQTFLNALAMPAAHGAPES